MGLTPAKMGQPAVNSLQGVGGAVLTPMQNAVLTTYIAARLIRTALLKKCSWDSTAFMGKSRKRR